MNVFQKCSRATSRVILFVVFGCLVIPVGCVSKRSEMGVHNEWRNPAAPVIEKGRSTEMDVMRALGPPSQVIGLQDRTIFYYLREQSDTKSAILLIYNQTRQEITYDRAIFFFDKNSVLTDFSYSPETVARDK